MRKSISTVEEAVIGKSLVSRKIMNDIMFYLRKLIKLARQAQSLMVSEGIEIDEKVIGELADIESEVDLIEQSL